MTLYVRPNFYDFFIRGMDPLQHYWPIRDDSKCTSLKFAVEWGNKHADKVSLSLQQQTWLYLIVDLLVMNHEYGYEHWTRHRHWHVDTTNNLRKSHNSV